ncbi:MAG: hypothetical protein KKA84_03045 [Bacteroidetes bacterium]|nr:hypothetical protein [Bacteroidota bacterium]
MKIVRATKEDITTISELAVEFRNSLQKETPNSREFIEGISRLIEGRDAEFFLLP